jgi:hypothetical protein
MRDTLTLANINLYSILPNLEDLCELDTIARSIISTKEISIMFTVKNGPQCFLSFKDGKCFFKRGSGRSDIKLFFNSPEHLNKMFEGKANPIPYKGFTKIGFLKDEFSKLIERLEYYLKPNDELLKNEEYLKINTIFTANTAIFALTEIANNDKMGKVHLGRMPEGIISVRVKNTDLALKLICEKGKIKAEKGIVEAPRATMVFSDINSANMLLNGRKDSYTLMAEEAIEISGYIPMIDCLDKLLDLVQKYLK